MDLRGELVSKFESRDTRLPQPRATKNSRKPCADGTTNDAATQGMTPEQRADFYFSRCQGGLDTQFAMEDIDVNTEEGKSLISQHKKEYGLVDDDAAAAAVPGADGSPAGDGGDVPGDGCADSDDVPAAGDGNVAGDGDVPDDDADYVPGDDEAEDVMRKVAVSIVHMSVQASLASGVINALVKSPPHSPLGIPALPSSPSPKSSKAVSKLSPDVKLPANIAKDNGALMSKRAGETMAGKQINSRFKASKRSREIFKKL